MSYMFCHGSIIDLSNVITMNSMFYNAKAFNQPVGNWDLSNVTEMGDMFCHAESNQHDD